jgi:hypothetical protein
VAQVQLNIDGRRDTANASLKAVLSALNRAVAQSLPLAGGYSGSRAPGGISSRAGTLYSSAAQAPRSIALQRLEQNGR